MKLVPLSDKILELIPYLAENLCKAAKNDSIVNSVTNSKYIPLVAKQTAIQAFGI